MFTRYEGNVQKCWDLRNPNISGRFLGIFPWLARGYSDGIVTYPQAVLISRSVITSAFRALHSNTLLCF